MLANNGFRRFQRCRTTINTTGSEACLEIIGPSANRISLIESIDITLATAVATTLLVGRPTAIGVTPTSPVPLWPLDNGDNSLATLALAWANTPTTPVNLFNRVTLPATIGSRIVLTYPDGVALRNGQTFVLFNVGTIGILDVAVTLIEF